MHAIEKQLFVKCKLEIQAGARKIRVAFGGRHFGEEQ
jgi:hypothetical protein